MKNLIVNVLLLTGALLYGQSAAALVVTYDFVAEAAGNEGGFSAHVTDGDSGSEAITLTATASNFAGDTDYFAYLDDASGGQPAGLGACTTLVGGEGSACDEGAVTGDTDNLNSGIDGGQVLTLAWNQIVTFQELAFRNQNHGTTFGSEQDFEVRIDGGAWQSFSLQHMFNTPLSGSTFDFIVDDTFGNDGCQDVVCADEAGSALYISSAMVEVDTPTVETPEPGMVLLFLLGLGLVGFGSKQRKQA